MINLFGEYVVTESDIARNLIKDPAEVYNVENVDDTKQGFRLVKDQGVLQTTHPGYHTKTGFYSIYRKDTCIYVGYTKKSIGNRISRFLKEVRGKSRFTETHPAANKFITMWGRDVSDVTIKVYPYLKSNTVRFSEIESHMIKQLNPILNSKKHTNKGF